MALPPEHGLVRTRTATAKTFCSRGPLTNGSAVGGWQCEQRVTARASPPASLRDPEARELVLKNSLEVARPLLKGDRLAELDRASLPIDAGVQA
eukprot:9477706-Pyramimonas_sp.AAC.1